MYHIWCHPFLVYSNDVFKARTQLAIIDHNHHIGREQVTTSQGQAYHRQWKRRTKEWDVTPRKEKKSYSYIPDLLVRITHTTYYIVTTSLLSATYV